MRNIDEEERAARLAAGRRVDLAEVRAVVERYAAARGEIEAAWLFGSQAQGGGRHTSDLDIALQVQPRPDGIAEIAYRGERARDLEALLGVGVDVVLLSPDLPLPLLWGIVRHPVIIYEREPGVGVLYGAYLRAYCRDHWPRVERRWRRTEQWLEASPRDATARHA